MKAPLLGVTAGFVAGIATGSLWAAFVAIAVASIFLIFKKSYLSIVAAAVAAGAIVCVAHRPPSLDPSLLGKKYRWSGEVTEASYGGAQEYLVCKIDSVQGMPLSRTVKIRVNLLNVSVEPLSGCRVEFNAKMRSIDYRPDVPDERDLTAAMRRQGIAASCMATNSDSLRVTRDTPDLFPRARLWLLTKMQRVGLDNGCYSFLAATLLGETSMLLPDTRQSLAEAGVAHMLALSGLHVGVITLILSFMFYPLRLVEFRWIYAVLTIALLWLFALLTGMSPSVTRAAIMATMVLLGKAAQRENDPINALCLAAIVILLFDPQTLYGIGFQMSFSAVLTILLLAEPIGAVFGARGWRRVVGSYIGASIAAMASAGVLSIYYFHIFPVYFLIGNLLAALLLPPMLIIAVVALAIAAAGFSPTWLGWALNILYWLMAKGAEAVSSLPGSSIDDIYISPWALIPAALAVAAFTVALRRRRWPYAVIGAGCAALAFMVTPMLRPRYAQSEYYITRNSHCTNILARDADSLYLIVTGHGLDKQGELHTADLLYGDYRGLRGLDHISIAPDSIDGINLRRRGNLLFIGPERIAIVNGDGIPSPDTRITKLIVAQGFTSDIVGLYNAVKPDSIILSADLHPTRAARYLHECGDSIPARRL